MAAALPAGYELVTWPAGPVRPRRGGVRDYKGCPQFSDCVRMMHALQHWHATYEAMQAAVAKVLDHLEDYREELAALMTERFNWGPEMPAETVPGWGS